VVLEETLRGEDQNKTKQMMDEMMQLDEEAKEESNEVRRNTLCLTFPCVPQGSCKGAE
jgi:hypothetical protein